MPTLVENQDSYLALPPAPVLVETDRKGWVSAKKIPYDPTIPADWADPDPIDVGGALDAVASSGGAGGVTDHGALTGLGDVDDHLLYLDLAGTRSMTGDLSTGSNSIDMVGGSVTNVTNVIAAAIAAVNGVITTGHLYVGSDLSAKFSVDGDTDEPQVIIKGHVTQTDAVFKVQNNAGSELFRVFVDGTAILLGDLTVKDGSISKIIHGSDTDTFLQFDSDKFTIHCGGVEFVKFVESVNDLVTFNPNRVDVNFSVNTNGNTNTLNIDGLTHLVSINSTLNVNTINEHTGATGVTIDSVLIKDGLVDGVDVSTIIEGGPGTDTTAIHDNVADEIKTVSEDLTPYRDDEVLTELATGGAKRSVKLNNIPGMVPIGGIIAWHKTMTGVPVLAHGFLECDGSTISDIESPMNGQTLPDMNGLNYYVRGNSTSGGTLGVSVHTLNTNEMPGHGHPSPKGTNFEMHTGGNPPSGTGTGILGDSQGTATGNAGKTQSHENKPPSIGMLWVMRIK